MPIIRKIIDVGKTSRAVIIPKSWLQYHEEQAGQPIDAVAIEVDEILRVSPYIKKRKEST